MRKPILITFCILSLFMILPGSVISQITLSKSVIGSGGTVSSNEEIQLSSTLGQSVIGRGPTDDLIYEIGFWYGLNSDLSTSTDDLSSQSLNNLLNLSISPNPVRTLSLLKYSLKKKSMINIKLISLSGRTYLNIDKGSQKIGEYTEEIDLSALPKGMYVCQLSTVRGHQNLKVINL